MKKSTYLKISQHEANKKLQQLLFERYNRIKQKSSILAYLYFLFSYIAFSSIAIVSFMYRLAMFFQDIRFTPHYMKTVIEHNYMSAVQANDYLDSQLLEYKKRLSYGNISLKEKNSIDTTFSLLYDEYKLPKPIDYQHKEITSALSDIQISVDNSNKDVKDISVNISDIQTSVDKSNNGIKEIFSIASDTAISIDKGNNAILNGLSNTHQAIEKGNTSMLELHSFVKEQGNIASEYFSNLKLDINEQAGIVNENIHKTKLTIEGSYNKIEEIASISKSTSGEVLNILDSVGKVATYTKQRQQKEAAELKREQTLREEQEKRQTTAYNREKGKKLTSFESALSENQIKILTSYCNQIPVFDRDIELQEMKDILLCTHTKPLKVTVNKYVAFLFTELSKNKFICKTWKSVAERYNCFVSSENKVLNSNDLYMTNQTSGLIEQKIYDMIQECIEEIIQ
ncbi:hypothetical protein [Dysgonomonas sp. GY617]|uniref:hypothetical protein n=1 Tax=Dysgonomonas sp. GY617 TaxID=2780420 RepID=UPI0018839D98|nr:hypothetical protein [Dysgonomonas sp. GY617]MBF0577587.1 hypothetical protein [Dysgonomonas sp. GY617]